MTNQVVHQQRSERIQQEAASLERSGCPIGFALLRMTEKAPVFSALNSLAVPALPWIIAIFAGVSR
jgi:hypothetical protein